MEFCTEAMDKDLHISTRMVYSNFSKYRFNINKHFHKVNPKQMEATWQELYFQHFTCQKNKRKCLFA